MRKRTARLFVAILILPVVFSGCQSAPPGSLTRSRGNVALVMPDVANPSTPSGPVFDLPEEVEIVEFEIPEDFTREGEDGVAESGTAVVNEQRDTYTVRPVRETFQGGTVTYNYVEGNVYQIFAAPMMLVDLQLQPGEALTGPPAAGDTINWMVETSVSITEGRERQHVYIKPLYPGRETTLSINTNRRSYHFQLLSFRETYMPVVAFNYPTEVMQRAREAARRQNENIYLTGNITDFDFNYEIVPMSAHRPSWMPSIVFNDGQKTYLSFASARRASYAPVLFTIEDGERVLVNYRVQGSFYIVDRVINRAELVLDVNAGNIVLIQRTSGS